MADIIDLKKIQNLPEEIEVGNFFDDKTGMHQVYLKSKSGPKIAMTASQAIRVCAAIIDQADWARTTNLANNDGFDPETSYVTDSGKPA